MLLVVTSVLWLYQWLPALSVAAFLGWIVLHHRLEGNLGAHLLRGWRRVWPPAIIVVVPLLVVGTIAYWMSGLPIERKILPIGMNLLALSLIVCSGTRMAESVKRTRSTPTDNGPIPGPAQ